MKTIVLILFMSISCAAQISVQGKTDFLQTTNNSFVLSVGDTSTALIVGFGEVSKIGFSAKKDIFKASAFYFIQSTNNLIINHGIGVEIGILVRITDSISLSLESSISLLVNDKSFLINPMQIGIYKRI